MIKIDDAVLVVVDDKTDSDLAGDVLLPQVGRGNFKLDTRRLEVVTVGDIYGASLPAVSDFSPDLQLVEFHLPLQKKTEQMLPKPELQWGIPSGKYQVSINSKILLKSQQLTRFDRASTISLGNAPA